VDHSTLRAAAVSADTPHSRLRAGQQRHVGCTTSLASWYVNSIANILLSKVDRMFILFTDNNENI
jgi:hypothetical protein